jgi:pimeloyl-ACP methyl ester carboxylesterase
LGSIKIAIVRAVSAGLERVAPAVGARWAERLWFTLPRRRPVMSVPGGTRFAVSVEGRPARVVLISPIAGVTAFERTFAAALGYGERTRRLLLARAERRVGAPVHHFDLPALGRAVLMPKTLIIHDRADPMTPVAAVEEIAATWAGSRLVLTSGSGHRRLLREAAVVAEVVDFVTT